MPAKGAPPVGWKPSVGGQRGKITASTIGDLSIKTQGETFNMLETGTPLQHRAMPPQGRNAPLAPAPPEWFQNNASSGIASGISEPSVGALGELKARAGAVTRTAATLTAARNGANAKEEQMAQPLNNCSDNFDSGTRNNTVEGKLPKKFDDLFADLDEPSPNSETIVGVSPGEISNDAVPGAIRISLDKGGHGSTPLTRPSWPGATRSPMAESVPSGPMLAESREEDFVPRVPAAARQAGREKAGAWAFDTQGPDGNSTQVTSYRRALIVDLDSHVTDVAIGWQKNNRIKQFLLHGDCGYQDLSSWTEDIYKRGAELRPKDFGKHGIEIDFSMNPLGSMGPQELERFHMALKRDQKLSILRLDSTDLGDHGAELLAASLMTNNVLKELFVSHNGIGDEGGSVFGAALERNKTLRLLDLSRNCIGSRGAAQLAKDLSSNRALTELDLSKNKIGYIGAEHFAEAVDPDKSSTVLKTLKLSGNQIGEEGLELLAAAFEKNCSAPRGRLTTLHLQPGQGGILMKKNDSNKDKSAEPERFIVICSDAGVGITKYEG